MADIGGPVEFYRSEATERGEISGTEYGIGKTGSLKLPMKGLELARRLRTGLDFRL